MLKRTLSALDAGAVIVGIIVGIGVFKTPAIIAANVANESGYIGLWLLGGLITFIAALCYSELSSTYPHVGGEYYFLRRAYGKELGFLFAWGRMAVMQSGSIAAVSFVYGDYATFLFPLGPFSPAAHAAIAIIALSALQILGTKIGGRAQIFLTMSTVAVVVLVSVVGLNARAHPADLERTMSTGSIGLALVFVLLTYGGWSEAAYLSGEVRDTKRDLPRALLLGIAIVTLLYLLVNLAYLNALGLDGLKQSKAVAADVVSLAAGPASGVAVAAMVCVASLSTLNATILTGARSVYAVGQDFPPFAVLGKTDLRGTPRNAILAQAVVALGLVSFGAFSRDGFEATVEYTAPVFWLFMLLVGVSLFESRIREPNRPRPFEVPLYPLTPLFFCLTSAYLLYSSLMYTGAGAIVGVAIFLLGLPILLLGRKRGSPARRAPERDIDFD